MKALCSYQIIRWMLTILYKIAFACLLLFYDYPTFESFSFTTLFMSTVRYLCCAGNSFDVFIVYVCIEARKFYFYSVGWMSLSLILSIQIETASVHIQHINLINRFKTSNGLHLYRNSVTPSLVFTFNYTAK